MKAEPFNIHGEALFEAVLNTISDGVTVIDRDFQITFQNEGGPAYIRCDDR